jgi:hypothetical protein
VPPGLTDSASGVSLIENVNLRPWEPVAPDVKPYRQHEYVAGWDYQIKRGWDFEARYDRRRLDHVIEDSSLSDPDWGETYTIVNPGEGVNATVNGYANFLTSLGQAYGVPGWAFNADPNNPFGTCGSCPPMPKAVRNYDGLEFRLTLTNPTRGLSGMVSYTWSSLWGNYTGLTTTDQSDATRRTRPERSTSRSTTTARTGSPPMELCPPTGPTFSRGMFTTACPGGNARPRMSVSSSNSSRAARWVRTLT